MNQSSPQAIAALIFSLQLTERVLLLRAVAGFAIFCVMSGAVYLLNDLKDRERDRLHPIKARRPIASGALSVTAAWVALVVAVADLWIDKTGIFLTENPSKTIRYTLTVHNDEGCSGDDPQVCGDGGPSDAQDVVVVDTLPSTAKKLVVTFVSEDCTYDSGSHTVTCTMGVPLQAGDSVFFEIEARPRGGLREITNVVTVSSSTTDPDSGNNTDELLMDIGGGGQK